jgi:hypothetical protein
MSSPGTFERAKGMALDAVSRAARTDLAGVVLFSDTARVAAAASADRTLAASAIDRATAGFGGTRYDAALQAAGEMLAAQGSGHGTIVLVTDLQQQGWGPESRASLPEAARLEIADAGVPAPNLAVTSVTSHPDHVSALIRNFGVESRDARVTLTVDGRSAGEAHASVGGTGTAEVLLPPAKGRTAQVTVDDRLGIAGDNVRYMVLDGGDDAGRASVVAITTNGDLARDAIYVREALSVAGRDGATYGIEGVSGSGLSAWNASRLVSHAAVLVLSTRGLDSRARALVRDFVHGGGGLLVAASPDVDGEILSDMLGRDTRVILGAPQGSPDAKLRRAIAPVDGRHPLFRGFAAELSSLSVANFTRLAPVTSSCPTLARFTTGETALLDCAIGSGRALVLASDLDNRWNDWPVRATFVPFLHEALHYLTGGRKRAREYLVSEVPAGASVGPSFSSGSSGVPGGSAVPGVWASGDSAIAVNVDPRESDPARLSADELTQAVARWRTGPSAGGAAGARQQEERQHLWQYAMIAVAALLAAESLIAAKTA